MQLRHPVRLRPLEAHDHDRVGGELTVLEGVLHLVLFLEDADRRFDHMALGLDGGDLDHAAPEIAFELLQAARFLERIGGLAEDFLVLAFGVGLFPDQTALGDLRLLGVAGEAVARDGLRILMQ